MANAFQPGRADLTASERALIDRRSRLLGPAYRLFYDRPLHFVRGEGVWLYDADGMPFLDVYNNVAVVGHCHPRVVSALTQQASLLNTHTRYLHEGILDYAEALLATLPAELGHMLFTCTGSEANDLAYRLAKEHTGGTGFIVTELAYHGGTNAIASLSPSLGKHVPLGTHVRTVRAPDRYRRGDLDMSEAFAKDVHDEIVDMRRHGIRPAALLVDSLFTSDGVFSDPPGFLRRAVEEIREAGGIFIADEVQAGFARTGERMWGFERHGVVPDIVTMGKPMGAGYPIAGVAVRPSVVEEFSHSRYFNTFGGGPVAAAVGLAVLDVIRSEGLQDNATVVGTYLRHQLGELGNRHEVIGDVRGAGLFVALELVSDRTTKAAAPELTARVVNELRARRILISSCGPFANVLKIRPPLVFSKENADQFLTALDKVLGEIQLPRGR